MGSLPDEPRYAVLCDLDTPDLLPCGFLLETEHGARLLTTADYGLRAAFPHFDKALESLSRTFLVVALETIPARALLQVRQRTLMLLGVLRPPSFRGTMWSPVRSSVLWQWVQYGWAWMASLTMRRHALSYPRLVLDPRALVWVVWQGGQRPGLVTLVAQSGHSVTTA